jgi:hypothetical protein
MTEERKFSTTDIADLANKDSAAHAAIEHAPQAAAAIDERPTPLFVDEELTGYRTRWSGIQTGFVDEPRKAVEEADTLVAELMTRLADGFAGERRRLEEQWEKAADKVSTEDLRLAMRRYRSFFERLLSI